MGYQTNRTSTETRRTEQSQRVWEGVSCALAHGDHTLGGKEPQSTQKSKYHVAPVKLTCYKPTLPPGRFKRKTEVEGRTERPLAGATSPAVGRKLHPAGGGEEGPGGAEAERQGGEASYLPRKLNGSRVKSHQTWLGFTEDDGDGKGSG